MEREIKIVNKGFTYEELKYYCDNKVLSEEQYIEEFNYDQVVDSTRYLVSDYVRHATGKSRSSGKCSKNYFIKTLKRLLKEGK